MLSCGAEFKPFQKIPRLSRDIVITEKIDGTNGVIHVCEDGAVLAGSRNRWLNRSLGIDNFAFALWVEKHEDQLRRLGPGTHHGEWWGHGIQRGYGLSEKRFSLFNPKLYEVVEVLRSGDPTLTLYTVPVMYTGPFDTEAVTDQLLTLKCSGSFAAPGFMQPEGVVIYHTASGALFKKTIEGDEKPKGVKE